MFQENYAFLRQLFVNNWFITKRLVCLVACGGNNSMGSYVRAVKWSECDGCYIFRKIVYVSLYELCYARHS